MTHSNDHGSNSLPKDPLTARIGQIARVKAGSDNKSTIANLQDSLKTEFEASPEAISIPDAMPVCIAIRAIAMPWLGADAPSKQHILTRFGGALGTQSLDLLGNELQAHLKTTIDAPNLQQAPYVQLLDNGQSVVVVGEAEGQNMLLCYGANGVFELEKQELDAASSGRAILVTQNERATKINDSDPIEQTEQSLLRRIISLVVTDRQSEISWMIGAGWLSNCLIVTLPLFIMLVYDRVIPHGAFDTLTALMIGVTIIFALDIGLRLFRTNLQESIGVRAGLALQDRLYRKLTCAALKDTQTSASRISAQMNDAQSACLLIPPFLLALAADLPFIFVVLAIIYYLAGPVVFAPLVGLVIVITLSILSNMRTTPLAGEAHEKRVALFDQTIETAASLPTIKSARAEHQMMHSFEGKSDLYHFISHNARQITLGAGQATIVLMQAIIAFTVVLGAYQVNAGEMTIGNLAATTLLVGRVTAPASTIISLFGQMVNMKKSLMSLLLILEKPDEQGSDTHSERSDLIKGNLSLSNISYSYEGASKPSIDAVSINIKAGEKVGIIGRSGCGKSTLLKLLPRLYDATSGSFLIEGHDVRQYAPQHIRQSMGYMAQETVLMNASLQANICLGIENPDPALFTRAVNVSGVSGFASKLPEGYSFNVGPRGENLSGGERQAVGLARVLMQNPSTYLLDEPTSSMDSSSEQRLTTMMPDLLRDQTLILSTHRIPLLALVDRVIWMEGGRIVADGPRDEVMKNLTKAAA